MFPSQPFGNDRRVSSARYLRNVIDFPRGLKVDLIVRKDRDFSVAEFDRRETHEVEGMRLTIATPEEVLLAKLEWAKIGDSERQLTDAACPFLTFGVTVDGGDVRLALTGEKGVKEFLKAELGV